ncbi:MAG TPA: cation:proton antiporter [Phototrophicaceae bacterium]|jgi:Kef-type K+ transport system membrane component KefB|nr:cation:proton antiporter [Phototrophicaceae bacterium]
MENNSAVALFLALAIVIGASRIGGAIARTLNQPRVLGELILGVILGPTLLNMLGWDVFHGAELSNIIKELAELGVLFLMFLVGIEVNPHELREVGKVSVFAGVFGALAPVIVTIPIVLLFNYSWEAALFAGITFAATSVSISAQVLLELGVLRTREGNALLATAVIDDILAIILVSLAIAITASTGTTETSAGIGEMIGIVIRMFAFMGIAFLIAWYALPKVIDWINHQPVLQHAAGMPAFALIFMLFFAWSAEAFGGVAPITGAFIAGIGFSRVSGHVKHEVEVTASSIAYAFLVPVFFINVGLETNLSQFQLATIPLTVIFVLIAVATKVFGCGLGARAGGFNQAEATRLGVCMISRGEVGLIIASLGIKAGVFTADSQLFIALFATIILTTLITPILVRQVFHSSITPQSAPQTR